MAGRKILIYNVQGIGGISKRTDIFEFLQNLNFDIYCLQETHFTDEEEAPTRTKWNMIVISVTTNQMLKELQYYLIKMLNIRFITRH